MNFTASRSGAQLLRTPRRTFPSPRALPCAKPPALSPAAGRESHDSCPCARAGSSLSIHHVHPERPDSSRCAPRPPRPPFCPCAVRAAACTKHCRRPHAARRSFGRRWSSWTFWIPSRRALDADAITFCSTCRFCFPISGERCALWLRRAGRHVPRCAACTFLRG